MKSIFNLFTSVKLTIVLLIFFALSSGLGTFIPQQRSPDEYVARFGQLANVLIGLQLTKLYQSLWFIVLLCLLALNIIICTLNRLSPKFKKVFRPRLIIKTKELVALKIMTKLKINKSLDTTKKELKRELSSRHYRIKETEKEKKAFLLARKKILGWFGADVVHLGIIIILVGGIISGLGGFKKNLTFSEGEVLDIPEAGIKLRLDKFETEYYPNSSVKDWKSTLTILKKDKSVLSRVIEVNHPLSYKGFVFYQSSVEWDWTNPFVEIWIKKSKNPSFLRKIKLKVGEKVRLEYENTQIAVLYFFPDFVINERNEITTRSLQPNNPAAFIEGWQADEKILSGWIFARFPDYSRIHSNKETDFSFELKDFKTDQFSVIQVRKDPGANFIWAGCALLMLGLFLAFYWSSREIKVILEEMFGKTEITAGGVASKNKDAFQVEFKKIAANLRRLN
ncbi:MAG: cytochrome c biogenesis protein ResB [Candidatus Aminicenantaceae bacterium]